MITWKKIYHLLIFFLVISSRIICDIHMNADGTVKKCKACLVALGNHQDTSTFWHICIYSFTSNNLGIYGLWRVSCPEFHASRGEALLTLGKKITMNIFQLQDSAASQARYILIYTFPAWKSPHLSQRGLIHREVCKPFILCSLTAAWAARLSSFKTLGHGDER